jgi:phosphate transport system permease protein
MSTKELASLSNPIYRRRRWVNRFNLVMSVGTMGFGMMFLFWILLTLFGKGITVFGPSLFTQMTPPPGQAGGLANAIFGDCGSCHFDRYADWHYGGHLLS